MAEAAYYENQNGVTVTDKCIIVGDNTYLTADITSVTTDVVNPKRVGLAFFGTVAILFVFWGFASTSYKWSVCGAIIAGLCFVAYGIMKPTWRLRIATSSGESLPLQSSNPQKISSIAQAIGQAIAHRT